MFCISLFVSPAIFFLGDKKKGLYVCISFLVFPLFFYIYGSYYKENPPARAAYGVVKLPLGALIEIETIAVK